MYRVERRVGRLVTADHHCSRTCLEPDPLGAPCGERLARAEREPAKSPLASPVMER
jgi:hypothetical protein